MLYNDHLKSLEKESFEVMTELINRASKKQTHPHDTLLILLHGFYNEQMAKMTPPTPYAIGQSLHGFAEGTMYDFYDHFRHEYAIKVSKVDFVKAKKDTAGYEKNYHLVTQMELMLYQRFWESDYILKQLYNFARLLRGEPYDWFVDLSKKSKKTLISHEIIIGSKKAYPKYAAYIDSMYNRQIRNAAAHSQFYLQGEYINFTNDNEEADHTLKSMHIDEWEKIFHKTVMFYNAFLAMRESCRDDFANFSRELGKALEVRIVKQDNSEWYSQVKPNENPYYKTWGWFNSNDK